MERWLFNRGAWLQIQGRRVDVHYRDLDSVDHEHDRQRAGSSSCSVTATHISGTSNTCRRTGSPACLGAAAADHTRRSGPGTVSGVGQARPLAPDETPPSRPACRA
jgi:hypothetical protein